MREPGRTLTFSFKILAHTLTIASLLIIPVAAAQTYTVLHSFTGGADGALPYAGLTVDAAGNLYGSSSAFATNGCGTAFKLTRHSGWTLSVLYSFLGSGDACNPQSRVVIGPNGALYGTTVSGGSDGYGTVYELQPPVTFCPTFSCPWKDKVLHSFTGAPDGQNPSRGDVIFDKSGNLYGVTTTGGNSGDTCANDEACGAVYEMTPSSGGWSESVIYNFEGGNDGAFPNAVALSSSGSLEGTTSFRGANSRGTVFSLTSNGHGQWSETTYYSFSGEQDGGGPLAGVIFDASGDLYGTTSYGGSGSGGTVWKLTQSGGNWLLNTLTSFIYSGTGFPPGSSAALTMDASGNLYGTTILGGANNQGSVFKLTPSGGGWMLTTLYSFTGGNDGGQPYGQLVLDADGNIYGTTSVGGSSGAECYAPLGCGVVFEITP